MKIIISILFILSILQLIIDIESKDFNVYVPIMLLSLYYLIEEATCLRVL